MAEMSLQEAQYTVKWLWRDCIYHSPLGEFVSELLEDSPLHLGQQYLDFCVDTHESAM